MSEKKVRTNSPTRRARRSRQGRHQAGREEGGPAPAPRADKADGESAVLAKIAAMPEPDRAMGERLHAIIKTARPALSPRLWYGMPAYARDGKVVCLLPKRAEVQHEVRRRSASCTRRTSTKAPCWPTAFALKELTTAKRQGSARS